MPKITFIRKNGQQFEVTAQLGQSIMEVATAHLVPGILGDCGGCVSCGTCEALIDTPWSEKLRPQLDDERALLDDTLIRSPRTRLTCQITVTNDLDGIVVRLP
jgi:2Fe-2S ferredoxin